MNNIFHIITYIKNKIISILKASLYNIQGIDMNILHSNISGLKIRKSLNATIKVGGNLSTRNVIFNITSIGNLYIGTNVFINDGTILNARENITIGDNVIIGQNVLIYDHDHDYRSNDIQNNFITSSVIIGNNVWIGSGCIILKGVVIEDNSVIAAGTIVTCNIPKNSILLNKRMPSIRNISS